MHSSEIPARFRLISFFIVLVLGAQLLAIVARPGKWTWPFTDYPMYATSRYEGERVNARRFVFGITDDGREVAITPKELGVNVFLYERWAGALVASAKAAAMKEAEQAVDEAVADAEDALEETWQRRRRNEWPLRTWLKSTTLFQMLKSKGQPDLAAVLTEHLQKVSGLKFTKLRVEDTPVVVGRYGQVPALVQTLEIDLPSAETRPSGRV
jgi:hypothetical protein